MKVVILGGTGLIGSKIVNILRAAGHEVVAASPSTGINSITGEGLPQALTGAHVVIDVTNAPSWEDKAVLEFFETSTRNVLAAEAMVVVYASFAARKWIGARAWRRLHWATYLVFALATVHGLAAGTDSGATWALGLYGGATGAVLAATAWRALVPPQKGAPRVPHRDRPLAL